MVVKQIRDYLKASNFVANNIIEYFSSMANSIVVLIDLNTVIDYKPNVHFFIEIFNIFIHEVHSR